MGDADNVDSLDLHGLVQAVLDAHLPQEHQLQQQQTFANTEEIDEDINQTLPHPVVVPHSILGVRDVGLGPNQRLFEPTRQHYLLNQSSAKNFGDEKLYYLKSGRPKVYVNVRGKTGNFRQDVGDSRVTVRIEPSAYLRATQAYGEVSFVNFFFFFFVSFYFFFSFIIAGNDLQIIILACGLSLL